MFSDELKIKGRLVVERFDTDGESVEIREIDNLVVQTGKVFIAERILLPTADVMSHMAVGIGTIIPVSTNVGLTSEIARVSISAAANADNVITYVGVFPAGVGTGPITEAGIFNAAVDGTMLSHTTFAVVNKGENDSVSITWSITIQ